MLSENLQIAFYCLFSQTRHVGSTRFHACKSHHRLQTCKMFPRVQGKTFTQSNNNSSLEESELRSWEKLSTNFKLLIFFPPTTYLSPSHLPKPKPRYNTSTSTFPNLYSLKYRIKSSQSDSTPSTHNNNLRTRKLKQRKHISFKTLLNSKHIILPLYMSPQAKLSGDDVQFFISNIWPLGPSEDLCPTGIP